MAKTVNDDLAEVIANDVNKLFKGSKVAYIGDEATPTDLEGFVSTGCALLDLAIANKSDGGVAFGRITEITGLEGSGKSLVAAHIMANVQKMNGVAVLIDTETAVNWDFFDAVGVDRHKNWIYTYLDTVEDIFQAVESIIETVRKSTKDKPVVIVIDSIAGASTKREMSDTYDTQGYATNKAILISQALRKITSTIGKQKIALIITNQLRQKLSAMPFTDPWTTSGGKALAFHSSTRIRLTLTGKIYKKSGDSKETVGVKAKAVVTKNRLGPPLRTAEFDVYFDRGIDDYGSWLKFLREKNIIDGKRVDSLSYTDSSGTTHSFSDKDWNSLLESNSKLKKELYDKLCETVIMSYSTSGLTSNDVVVEESSED